MELDEFSLNNLDPENPREKTDSQSKMDKVGKHRLNFNNLKGPFLRARNGDMSVLDDITADTINAFDCNENKLTLLHCAIRFHHYELGINMVEKSANGNAQGPCFMTPFHFACKYGEPAVSDDQNFQLLEQLIDKIVKQDQTILSSQDRFGMTGLHYAVLKGYHQVVLHLLNKLDTKQIDKPNNHGDTALVVAAQEGNTQLVNLILSKGGSFDTVNNDGMNIVHCTAFCGHFNLLEDLKDREEFMFMSFAKAESKKGNSLLHLSVASGSWDTVNWVLNLRELSELAEKSNKTGDRPIHTASKKNLPDILNLLLQNNNEKDAVNKDNETALMIGAEKGHDEIVRKLIETGANPDLKNNNSNTAIMLASQQGHQNIVEILLGAEANLDIKNKYHQNILHVVNAGGNTDILQIILPNIENDSLMEDKDLNDENPLHIAAKNKNADFMKILLESRFMNSKLVVAKNFYGETPCHIAAKEGNSLSVKEMLLKYPFVADVTDNVEQTPLCVSAATGSLECLELLLRCEAGDQNICNHLKGNMLQAAAENGHAIVVEELLSKKKR